MGLRAVEAQGQSPFGPSPIAPTTPIGRLPIGKRLFSPFPSRLIWTLPLNNALTGEPAYDGTFGYFPIEGNRLAAYDLTPGTLRWIATAAPRSAPAVGDGLLIIDQGERLTALRTMDGSTAWEIPLAEKPVVPLAESHGWLFAATPDALTAYHTSDGSVGWRRDVAGIRAAPTVTADRVFLSTDDGRVMMLRFDTGETVWAQKVGGRPNLILAVDAQIFVGSTDNYLYCLKLGDGEILWRKQTGADVIHRPVVDDDNVYFVSLDNVLRALNRGHGVQQWMRPLPFRPAWNPVMALDAVIVAGLSLPPRAYFRKDGAVADTLTVDKMGELAAPLHTFESPIAFGPVIIVVTKSTGEATVTASSRTMEPPPTLGVTPPPSTTPFTGPKL